MSNIDKQALREAAERAESDSWGYDRDEFNEALTPSTVLALLDELEAAEKRIAELETREVKLPNPHAHLIWIQAGHAPDDYWDDVAVSHSEKDKCCDGSDRYPVYALWEIKEALSAIGINIAASGKGEAS
ncbi:ead/Ea22-like family protein [Enterobacter kobei]|uniref:ead/Ea22-like family protein n=1 Tax=Enterobacter kobei TaxID=208224 RepID=UPI002003165C|nr:ead/Ea22-like family protein [Enterobacter kobei]MCK7194553.1 ead/Ea22-like family protein [Enterobacter kobei]